MKIMWRAIPGLVLWLQASGTVAAPALTVLRSFGFANAAAANPCSEVTEGRDGRLYGTTPLGGSGGRGAVFCVNKDGSGFQLLRSFGAAPGDGTRPAAALIEANDGNLYGSTVTGGQFGFGTVFRLSENGSNYTVLWNFLGTNDAAYPEARLLEASDGLLYGTASGGGTNDYGALFRLAKDGSGYQSLFQFVGTNGANPEGGLIEGSDGRLYGTTVSGGSPPSGTQSTPYKASAGAVFSVDKTGTNFALLRTFFEFYGPGTYNTQQTNGYAPYGRFVEGTNGMLYGTTSSGGTNGNGTIYRMNKDGSGYHVIYHFAPSNTKDGRIPSAELVQASDSCLYGTTYDGGSTNSGTVFRIGQDGSSYTVLANLSSVQGAAATVCEGSDGLLYGTTQLGGAAGAGAVFKLQKDGTGFVLVTSFSASGGDGQGPSGALTLASDGALYGTTRLGGTQAAGTVYSLRFDGRGYRQVSNLSGSGAGPSSPFAGVIEGTNGALYGDTQYGGSGGDGTIFGVQKDGSGYATLYSPAGSTNGQELRAALIQASDGALYGTTVLGGSDGQGVLFQANADGSGFAVLTNFLSLHVGGASGPGGNPVQSLIEASDHTLYGTAYDGGAADCGTIFKLNRGGSGFTVLMSFTNTPQGANPASPLLEASDGFLYGTTYSGGTTNNAGTVFRIAKDGTGFRTLYAFSGTGGDARHPCGKLVQGSDGMLYGTAERGGLTDDQGALFTLSTNNGIGYAVLASFGGAAGQYPKGGLTVGPDGAFYGATDRGGSFGFGTVFRYGAPIEEITALGFSGNSLSLTCLGAPGTNYWLERTASLGPPTSWVALLSTNAPSNGQFTAVDQSPLPTGAFYRLRR